MNSEMQIEIAVFQMKTPTANPIDKTKAYGNALLNCVFELKAFRVIPPITVTEIAITNSSNMSWGVA